MWKPKTWSKPGEVKQEVNEESSEGVKTEEPCEAPAPAEDTAPPPQPSPPPPEPPVKNEPEEPKLDEMVPPSASNGLFRKRKAPPSTAGSRGVKKR